MKKIQNFCVLLLFSWGAFVFGMEHVLTFDEQIDVLVGRLCNRIDCDMLGINLNSWGRSIVSAYVSRSKNLSLTIEKAIEDLSTISGWFESFCAELVFEKLEQRHWYFSYLVKKIVEAKIAALNSVQGSTIDAILQSYTEIPGLPHAIEKFILQKIHMTYEDGLSVSLPFMHFEDKENDIHCISLCGHTEPINIEDDKLLLSSDGKYIKAVQSNDKCVMWDIATGDRIADSYAQEYSRVRNWGRYTWTSPSRKYCVMDESNVYLATDGRLNSGSCSSTIYAMQNALCKNRLAILLIKRPSLASYVCQKALCNSSRSSMEELSELKNSQTVKELKGFPQLNLLMKIDEKMKSDDGFCLL